MSDEREYSPKPPVRPLMIDLSEPHGPMELIDWVEMYPTLPVRTISLCVWEANTATRSQDSDAVRNAAVIRLIAARLEESRQSVSS
jgi:hypothetical protein